MSLQKHSAFPTSTGINRLQLRRCAVRQRYVSSTPALRGRRFSSAAAAALIGIGLTVFLQQTVGIDGPGILFLALGGGLFLAYFTQPLGSRLIVPAGILSGLGLGITLVSGNLTPGYLHGSLIASSLALGVGAIYIFGDTPRHRRAIYPAMGLALIAWLSFVTSAPWLKDTFGALTHFMWPLLLVAGGLWLIERGRREADPRS
jgi:hypothetical protein